ncbi:MAG: hypothetical protein AABW91_01000 [Nanoarchaeota archaeon]
MVDINKEFDLLESRLKEAYHALKERDPNNFLLAMADFKEDGSFTFTPEFDRQYNGGTVRARYNTYISDLKKTTTSLTSS